MENNSLFNNKNALFYENMSCIYSSGLKTGVQTFNKRKKQEISNK